MTGGFEVAVDRQFAARTEECFELLDEIKALEDTEQVLRDHIAILKDLNRIQGDFLTVRDTKIAELRAQLAEWELKRTLGGPAKPYTPDWSANAKLNGNRPPPYTPKDKS